MKRILEFFEKLFTKLLLPQINVFAKEAVRTFRKVQYKNDAIIDILVVMRSLLFYNFLLLLSILFFCILPQGIDILYSVIEHLKHWEFRNAIFLLLATMVWSIMAEFAARYRIYVKDNSGNFLPQERVAWRAFVQRSYAKIFLLLPFLIIITGGFIAAYRWEGTFTKCLYAASGLICIMAAGFFLVYNLYFSPKWIALYGRIFSRTIDYEGSDEKKVKNLLLGIYNNFVFKYPNLSVDDCAKLPITPDMDGNKPYTLPEEIRNFPMSDKVVDFFQPPKGAKLIRVTFPVADTSHGERGDAYIRWEYKLPLSIFPVVHKELLIAVVTGIILLIGIPALPNDFYQGIGSAALVAFAFAGWIGISSGFLFIDTSNVFKSKFLNNMPWRLVLFGWLLFSSVANKDHPVRFLNHDVQAQAQRPTLKQHFNNWMNSRLPDTTFKAVDSSLLSKAQMIAGKDSFKINSIIDSLMKDRWLHARVPVVFVCAEGGALRTGAMAATLLAKIQDSLHWFKDNIYAYSTVSGGSVGISFFNAITYLNGYDTAKASRYELNTYTDQWFSEDFLAPVIAKLFYSDIFHLFTFFDYEFKDRASALEEAWECGYQKVRNGQYERNVYSYDFLQDAEKSKAPAWFINTTEVETGHQCWITNVIPPDELAFANHRDLLGNIPGSVRYSTAINFSTRFPLISPAAAVPVNCCNRYHYVDGGYVENTGSQTMLEVLLELSKDTFFQQHAIPYVMLIRFGPDNSKSRPEPVKFCNEWREIVDGIYNSRNGRTELARYHLKGFVKRFRDSLFLKDTANKQAILMRKKYNEDFEVNFDTDERKVPMNWLLSTNSLEQVQKYCDSVLRQSNAKDFLAGLSVINQSQKRPDQ